ncbi:3'-5' exonuclease [Bradyrhizobium quebecense]|uniref:Uncharacterized protein n=1 Tax=Bradyrhizobium quebecense TaxID=2748629 RepID=A0ACD3VLV5_9BRAD|nr:3'-5' exonuclease [Bradyrhizobium quebecense]UGY07461.1 hypothetical protein J4P68_0040530 [Bradyrhizobium quebecense]
MESGAIQRYAASGRDGNDARFQLERARCQAQKLADARSLAFKATSSAYRSNSEKMTGKVNANQLVEMLNLKRWNVDGWHVLQPRSQGYLILDTLRRYMKSADAELAPIHVPHHGSVLAAPQANRTVDEERSDLTISTAHKAKGREWSTVRLMDDFLRSQPGKPTSGPDPAEVRLFYVALTCAKEAVEVPPTVLSLIR